MAPLYNLLSLWRRMVRRETPEATLNLTSIDDALNILPRRFSYKCIASATNNFSDEMKLGKGGFGTVYMGYLVDGRIVAVKKNSKVSNQGKKEYITELNILSRLRHRNLVRLIGWCHESGEFIIVYDFMPNGSLDSHLFGERGPLTWDVRYRIALGLASGVLYLHEESEQCVVHRNITPSNIMLDSSFNVKLGDFGLARLMDQELGPQTTVVAGTIGYIAPEYLATGRAGKESDVYSFGVVALEIATGRKTIDWSEQNQKSLVQWIWELYGTGELLSAVDERLHMDFDKTQVECLMIAGLWCAHPNSTLRPSIRKVIQVLNFEAALPDLPMKMPVPMYFVPTQSNSSGELSNAFMTDSSLEEGR